MNEITTKLAYVPAVQGIEQAEPLPPISPLLGNVTLDELRAVIREEIRSCVSEAVMTGMVR